MAITTGTHFGHYRILTLLDTGGMGEVYRAHDSRLDREVAIKLLSADFAQDEDRLRRFEQEARATSALNHPNILTVYEIGEAEGKNYIATEFIEGKTLREHLSSGESISLSAILKIGVQVSEALAAAHQAGIIHRDIKPENIMIRSDGYAKVLDFGLAKLTEKKKSELVSLEGETKAFVQTNPGVVMGTVSYMSPEQARGKETDARTDIWSLGVVLYEMLSGKLPFTGETVNHTIVAILEKEPLLLENVPDELQRIVRKALTKDKEMRYQTARDLLIDLKNLRRTLDIQGELERSIIPNREKATNQTPENETRGYAVKSVEETNAEDAKATQNLTTASSLEYAVRQAKSHKLTTAIVGIILLGVISAAAYFGFFASGSNKQIESIAVMPFTNESGNADNEYLSDGMTETLIHSLSRLPNLSVKARSSVFRYKGKEIDPKKTASELNVQAVLIGRVAQRGDGLTLSLELIDAQTENVIWSESYNRRQADLVSLQSEIARDVSGKLKTKLSGADEQRVARTYTQNAEAYRLYLQGRFHWNKREEKEFRKAVEFFNQAIALDPNYALAYAGLADTYALLATFGLMPPFEGMTKAREFARQALSLDETLPEPHAALGVTLLSYGYDFAGAEREYQRAIELDPNYLTAHQWYGELLTCLGRFAEAFASYRRALEIDPLSLPANWEYARSLYYARRFDESIAQHKKVLELDAGFAVARRTLSEVYRAKGDYAEAAEEQAAFFELSGEPQNAALIREAFAKGGWNGFLRLVTAENSPLKFRRAIVARSYLELGEKEKAFAELDNAYRMRESPMQWLKVEPQFDPLRDDPRFQELLRRIGFAP